MMSGHRVSPIFFNKKKRRLDVHNTPLTQHPLRPKHLILALTVSHRRKVLNRPCKANKSLPIQVDVAR